MAGERDEAKGPPRLILAPGDDSPVLDRDQPAEPWPPAVLEEDEDCE